MAPRLTGRSIVAPSGLADHSAIREAEASRSACYHPRAPAFDREESSITSVVDFRLPSPDDGDEDIERLRADLSRAVRQVCPRWLADCADDLIQVALSRVVERRRAAGGGAAFSKAYLYRAAYSVLIDEIRRRRRSREVPLDSADVQPAATIGADRRIASQEAREAIERCLTRLVPARRRAVMLHLQGHSIAEVAALLEINHKSAENLVYRALADLRACLTKEGVAP
ncbi:MAG TPA: RNA polymerase sigma factor [Vicinamibacterales bacterium]|jgi:RNA polymerase sigma factor (sigma-70 family)